MLILEEKDNKFKTPTFVIYDDIIRYKLNVDYESTFFKHFSVPVDKWSDTMKFDEIFKYNSNAKYFDCDEIVNSIMICYNDNNVSSDIIKEILDCTYFTNGFEEWDITVMCRRYNITGKKVFIELCGNGQKTRNKILSKIFDDAAKKDSSDYVYFDYLIKGIGVKNKFPNDIYKSRFYLNMRRFNDRNVYCGYYRIINLFISIIKNSKPISDYEFRSDPPDIEPSATSKASISDKIKKINDKIVDLGNIEHYKGAWNWRNRYEKDAYKDIDPNIYDLEECYNTYFKESKANLDLANYFTLSPINTISNNLVVKSYIYQPSAYSICLENVSIINILLFSQSRVNYESLVYLLELVRLKSLSDYACHGVQIDNYIVKHYLTSNPKYSSVQFVKFDEHDNSFKFAKSMKDKTTVARYFITVAQEYPPDKINLHNFYMMYLFKEGNEEFSDCYNASVIRESHRLINIAKE